MTDREFRRLSRAKLMEIIDQLQANVDLYKRENMILRERLKERRLTCEQAGSIAEAALRVNDIFRVAQQAADEYLAELQCRCAEPAEEKAVLFAEGEL